MADFFRERRRKRMEGGGPITRAIRGDKIIQRRKGVEASTPSSSRPKIDQLRVRRRKKSPQVIVAEFRARFPDLDIPDPGPEPPFLEGELEPDAIEMGGTVWALRTAEGVANKFGETADEKEAIMRNLIPGMLASRETWERRTAAGIQEFIERILEEQA